MKFSVSRTFTQLVRAGALVATLALAVPAVAAPSATDKASARAIAEQAMDAYEAKRFSDAEDLFRRAEGLVHAPPHVLYLARAMEAQGKLVAAREALMTIKRESLPEGSPPAFFQAQESAIAQLNQVEARLPYLTIEVEGEFTGRTVQVNGVVLNDALVGVARPVDPGQIVIEVAAEGAEPQRMEIDLAEGAKEERSFVLVASKEALAATSAAGTADEPIVNPKNSKSGPSKIPAYIAFGVGAVGVAMGVVFLAQRGSNKSNGQDLFDECVDLQTCGIEEFEEIEDYDGKAATAGTLSLVSFGVGAAGIGTGLALFLLSSKKKESTASKPRIQPFASFNQLGVAGTF